MLVKIRFARISDKGTAGRADNFTIIIKNEWSVGNLVTLSVSYKLHFQSLISGKILFLSASRDQLSFRKLFYILEILFKGLGGRSWYSFD